jgi:tRNA pseudouridine55 synthase
LTAPGVLLRAKPAGVTSHDVVAEVRRSLPRGTKVGHAGTLDPFATGLLLVLIGRATRAQRFLMDLPKTYRAIARLGWTSDTGDRDGELVQTGNLPARLEIPVGEQLQRPHRAELLWHEGDRAAFEIECSAGTYVRTLIADLGDAYCEELERTAIGPFRLADAHPDRVVPLVEALSFLPVRSLDAAEAALVRHGRRVPRGDAGDGHARLVEGERLIAIGEARADELQPVVVFEPA